ncbi:SLC13 family permease [uncultured Nisaea sp.]|jgi:di/tricarboxylate transporter|uniref:SLC13 family permease n=1 Tax=uncultured Nisaea sp. TaxID=538215 RepID=UPI0030EB528C|tara:strand:+ start:3835 stop:5619 length:1785 start_codon:yes stop_codon:yes gene_type:complete
MTFEQIAILAIVVGALAAFIWGRYRIDLVAMLALLLSVAAGVVDPLTAFSGFGHPAVITVVAVLGMSAALTRSGAVGVIAERIAQRTKSDRAKTFSLIGLAGLMSSVMNNVGALALLMPITLSVARKAGLSPSRLLMPLSFASLLGGMITLIGTPPNIIIADYRRKAVGESFQMFDFLPVGLAVAAAGILYLVFIGIKLVPNRRGNDEGKRLFELSSYVTEFRVPADSRMIGQTISALGDRNEEGGRPTVLALLRDNERLVRRLTREPLLEGDLLLAHGSAEQIEAAVQKGLELVDAKELDAIKSDMSEDAELSVVEAVMPPRAWIEGRSAAMLRLRSRYGLNLLGVARGGAPINTRLRDVRFRAGDVLMLQGDSDQIYGTISSLGCLPLAQRRMSLERPNILVPALLFLAAIIAASVGILPAAVTLAAGLAAMVLTDNISMGEVYDAIDWQIVVLLGAMIPVGTAMHETGAAGLIAGALAGAVADVSLYLVLALLLMLTMFLTDMMNNAATALVMAPVALGISEQLSVNPDPLLMAVAIGSSSAFLTPIGHQNNLLVMGPAGYRFGDYWRVGLPLDLLIIAVAVPLLPVVWPF